ncbi:MAG: NAD(P)H-hydrate dehydratase [Chitinophagaceae bacterium]
MKLFSAEQIHGWDQYTISREPISSIDLMERATRKLFGWIREQDLLGHHFFIFCGTGNNGGDGLALARMLAGAGCTPAVYLIGDPEKGSDDFRVNLARLKSTTNTGVTTVLADSDITALKKSFVNPRVTKTKNFENDPGVDFQPLHANEVNQHQPIIIDAVFGSGLNKPPAGIHADVINFINQSGALIVAVDLPSGMFADRDSTSNTVINASVTLTFQVPKIALLMPSNAGRAGELIVLDIGLDNSFSQATESVYELVDQTTIHSIYKPRTDNSHKGIYGHALMVAGSYGKMGAAVLAASACLRSGAGLVTCHIPASGYQVLQTSLPEAMVVTDYNSSFNTRFDGDLSIYKVIGIGPGLGTASETVTLLKEIMTRFSKPMVIDADALNMIGRDSNLFALIPAGSILTPHPKEFERLFGGTGSDFERMQLAVHKARQLKSVIVLKGHHTIIVTPEGRIYFNNTGNGGLAKGGTGDTLTGIITAFLCQGYAPDDAAILAVYLHGLSADLVVKGLQSKETLLATDLIDGLGQAFKALSPSGLSQTSNLT